MLMVDGQPSASASPPACCLLPYSAAEALCFTHCSLVSHSAVLLMPVCHMTSLCFVGSLGLNISDPEHCCGCTVSHMMVL